MSRSVCSHPGCRSIATELSRCDIHQRTSNPTSTTKTARSSTTRNNHIYTSTKWKHLRKRKVNKNPLCENCLTFNIVMPVDVVDHIIELNDNEELAYVYSNLKSLCHQCHNSKTAKAARDRKHPKEMTTNAMFAKFFKLSDSKDE